MADLTPEQQAAADRLRVQMVQPMLTLRDLVETARSDPDLDRVLDTIGAMHGEDLALTLVAAVYALVPTEWGPG